MQTVMAVCAGWVLGDLLHGRFDPKIIAFSLSVVFADWMIRRASSRRGNAHD